MFTVKAFTGYKNGWKTIKTFGTAAEADNWLGEYVRRNGYSIEDFTIKEVTK